ncbi:pyridoxamine 5'-phosphate oxidase [Aeromicrobium camelliae]|uniref:Pyridoxamine 5'-phosphate oxidase n=1 Tax=Aeromicrobium camelliae TaxID=1538144 RepID=A0A3N6WNP7_9ACTN|nr:pyridoxamine 5'-phosphate oxidase family protein [Aeromicrobium camelliae]RQN02973.1 pyridoxamine 5'-phosphate oxidase [Aeromicrobium camelliae]
MTEDRDHLLELMDDMPIAMMTTVGPAGELRAVPMARQQVEPSAQMWFISARDTRHVQDINANPRVQLTFSSRDVWVAASGTATVVNDPEKLRELWTTFAEAWLPGGPDDPNAVLLRVDLQEGEYWDTPGGKVASALSFLKTRITGDTYDARHGSETL